MTTIYLLRHGQTEWNVQSRFQGQGDSPLTPLGRAQMDHVGSLLATALADHAGPVPTEISPLGRTLASADLVGRHLALARRCDDRLKEIAFGAWEGRNRADILAASGLTEGSKPVDWQFSAPGGESYDDLVQRAGDWLNHVERMAVPAVIAVSHGMIGRFVRGLYAGLARDDLLTLPVPQGGYWRLEAGQIDFFE